MSMSIRSGAIGAVIAALVSAAILVAAATLASLSSANADTVTTDPTATDTVTVAPTDTITPTPTDTASPTPTPTPTDTVTPEPTQTITPVPPGWQTRLFTLAGGRSYYARVPVCEPVESEECAAYLGKKRQVLLFTHGYNGVEDQPTAQAFLNSFGALRKTQNDTVFVYALSKDGLRAWNAGLCCTFENSTDVDDVTYLVDVASDIATQTAVNSARVGVFGWSNGGMIALKADCERPDVFDFGSSWAGTYVGPCAKAGVHVMQMHGSADTTVPVDGGTATVNGRTLTFPPAADLGSRLAKGNNFPLTIYNGIGHQPNATMIALQLTWSFANLKG